MKTAAEIAEERSPAEIAQMIAYWLSQPQRDEIATSALNVLGDAAEIQQRQRREVRETMTGRILWP